jgi:Rap1a immunity proteins
MRKLMPMGMVVGLAMTWVMPLPAGAVESDDFLAATTEDMVALCTASPDEAMADEAVHFCHGYLTGAFQYYQQLVAGPEADPFVCLPDPPPSRDEGVEMFVSWAQAHPQYMNEPAVETFFRSLAATWPCQS